MACCACCAPPVVLARLSPARSGAKRPLPVVLSRMSPVVLALLLPAVGCVGGGRPPHWGLNACACCACCAPWASLLGFSSTYRSTGYVSGGSAKNWAAVMATHNEPYKLLLRTNTSRHSAAQHDRMQRRTENPSQLHPQHSAVQQAHIPRTAIL